MQYTVLVQVSANGFVYEQVEASNPKEAWRKAEEQTNSHIVCGVW